MSIPNHVAIILDGNGRWAKSKGMPRNYGHVQGAKNVEVVCRAAYNMGIKYMTMYAFSTENWDRPQEEVEALMKLLDSYMATCLKTAKKNNMHVRVIGDRTRLKQETQDKIEQLEAATKEYDGLNFTIALNYGGRDEIVRSIRKIADQVQNGKILPQEITEQTLQENLDTKELPDPDLLIRTCMEQRISNFLLWQLAYTELYFADVAWPDFDEKALEKAVDAYSNRERRYGKIKEDE